VVHVGNHEMADWYVAVKVGRVVEGRPLVLKTRAAAVAYCAEFRRLVPPLRRAVICADYRAIAVFAPEVAEELKSLLADMNPFIERSAILVAPEHATGVLQVGRVVKETHHESRRRFTDAAEMSAWLGELLTPAESARVAEFLAEPVGL
jgi:hypothetical protein